jgi:hypothetical protein
MPTPKRNPQTLISLAVALLLSAPLQAQDIHVRVSPDLTSPTAGNTNFPTIQMALDHASQPGPSGKLYIAGKTRTDGTTTILSGRIRTCICGC